MDKFEKIKKLVADAEVDVDKFYKKENQAAGTRIRRTMQELKILAQEVRVEVQNKKNKA